MTWFRLGSRRSRRLPAMPRKAGPGRVVPPDAAPRNDGEIPTAPRGQRRDPRQGIPLLFRNRLRQPVLPQWTNLKKSGTRTRSSLDSEEAKDEMLGQLIQREDGKATMPMRWLGLQERRPAIMRRADFSGTTLLGQCPLGALGHTFLTFGPFRGVFHEPARGIGDDPGVHPPGKVAGLLRLGTLLRQGEDFRRSLRRHRFAESENGVHPGPGAQQRRCGLRTKRPRSQGAIGLAHPLKHRCPGPRDIEVVVQRLVTAATSGRCPAWSLAGLPRRVRAVFRYIRRGAPGPPGALGGPPG